jgi:hypothetical protein
LNQAAFCSNFFDDVGWALPTGKDPLIAGLRLFSTGNRNISNTNGTRGIFYWWAMPTLHGFFPLP